MTPRQRIELAQSKRRQRLGELLAIEERSADETAELARITDVEMPQGEVELRAAIAADDDPAPAADGITEPVAGIDPKRVELRNASSLAAFVSAAISGRPLSGAEAELAAEVNLGTGFVPLEMFTPPAKPAGDVETRAVTAAPDNVGVNLAPILPSIFARAVAGRLGVEMPRVPTGTYATGTITGDLTATAKGKTEATITTPVTITTATTMPHRISARLAIALEDIAAVGTDNFEASLRQNLSLVLSAKLDEYALRGTGEGVHPRGLMSALDAPGAAPANVVSGQGISRSVLSDSRGGAWGAGLAGCDSPWVSRRLWGSLSYVEAGYWIHAAGWCWCRASNSMGVSMPSEVCRRCRLCQISRYSKIALASSMRVCQRLRSSSSTADSDDRRVR